jgi:cardiolipin synthase
VAGSANGKYQRNAGEPVNGLFKHLPNILTGMRLVCAPALAFLLVKGADGAALGVFAFAGLSDAADGYFAKRFGFATRFGRFLDPAADKLLMLAAFVALTAMGVAPLWLAILVIARDAAIVAGILLGHALRLPLKIEPLTLGKWTTVVQVGYVGLSLLLLALGEHWVFLARVAVIVTAAMTAASWAAYGFVLLQAFAARSRAAA